MIQTLARSEDLHDLVRAYGHVVIDECHHVPAVQVERVLSAIPARYVTGLTATPYRRDGHQPIITMQCGPVRHKISGPRVTAGKALGRRVIRRDTSFDPSILPTQASIQEIYGALANDDDRLGFVLADIRELVREGRALVVLTERREHLERIAKSIGDEIPNVVVLHGGIKPKARRAAMAQLAEQPENEPRLILATGRYLGEGFDDPRLDTLLLTMPIAWKGTVVQYAGRLHRAHAAKRDIRIYDYVDVEVPVLRRMYAKRLRTYKEMGYACDESAQELSLANWLSVLSSLPGIDGWHSSANVRSCVGRGRGEPSIFAPRTARYETAAEPVASANDEGRPYERPSRSQSAGLQGFLSTTPWSASIAGAGFEPATFGL